MTRHPEEGTLHAYIDGELSPAEAAALEQHVSECAACSAGLAEARGLVAAASRVITTLDAAPSSAAKPVAPVAGVPAAPRRVLRPVQIPYARAAALLLLVGGTAFVFDRAGTSARGGSAQAESVVAGAVAEGDLAAAAPAETPTTAATAPVPAPEPRSVGVAQSIGAGTGTTGNARRESVVPRPTAATTAAPAEFTGRGVAGGVATKDAVPPRTEPPAVASSDAPSEVARPAALSAVPPPPAPARMTTTIQERAAASALNFAPTVVRYRTRDGHVLTLTEEPLKTIFAEESLATGRSVAQSARGMAAPTMAAPAVNSYRWSSTERGKTFTLSGPLTIVELEALSKRLAELERLP